MFVTRDNFHNVITGLTTAVGDDVAARQALRGIVVYVMSLESALDRADNARRAGAPNLPNPWVHVNADAHE